MCVPGMLSGVLCRHLGCSSADQTAAALTTQELTARGQDGGRYVSWHQPQRELQEGKDYALGSHILGEALSHASCAVSETLVSGIPRTSCPE